MVKAINFQITEQLREKDHFITVGQLKLLPFSTVYNIRFYDTKTQSLEEFDTHVMTKIGELDLEHLMVFDQLLTKEKMEKNNKRSEDILDFHQIKRITSFFRSDVTYSYNPKTDKLSLSTSNCKIITPFYIERMWVIVSEITIDNRSYKVCTSNAQPANLALMVVKINEFNPLEKQRIVRELEKKSIIDGFGLTRVILYRSLQNL